jgi:toxin CcdB
MQLDVFPNPLVRARRAFPFVVVLQSDIAALGQERIIAFLAPRAHLGPIAGRLMPVIEVDGRQFVLLMPSITNVPLAELRGPVANLHAYRDRIVDAIDWTFLGNV